MLPTRRDFIKTSLAAFSGACLGKIPSIPNPEPAKVATVGAGGTEYDQNGKPIDPQEDAARVQSEQRDVNFARATLGAGGATGLLIALGLKSGQASSPAEELSLLGKITAGVASKEDLLKLLPHVTKIEDISYKYSGNDYQRVLELELSFKEARQVHIQIGGKESPDRAMNTVQHIEFASASLLSSKINSIPRLSDTPRAKDLISEIRRALPENLANDQKLLVEDLFIKLPAVELELDIPVISRRDDSIVLRIEDTSPNTTINSELSENLVPELPEPYTGPNISEDLVPEIYTGPSILVPASPKPTKPQPSPEITGIPIKEFEQAELDRKLRGHEDKLFTDLGLEKHTNRKDLENALKNIGTTNNGLIYTRKYFTDLNEKDSERILNKLSERIIKYLRDKEIIAVAPKSSVYASFCPPKLLKAYEALKATVGPGNKNLIEFWAQLASHIVNKVQ